MWYPLFVLALFLSSLPIACVDGPIGPIATQKDPAGELSHLQVELRIGGGFTASKQGWLAQVADEIAQTLEPISPTPIAKIPGLGPFHKERLAEEGIIELIGVRVFIERLGVHHPQWELDCLGRSRQVYQRSADDPRTAIGVVFLAVDSIGEDEQLFKSIFRYHLRQVLPMEGK